LRRGQTPERSFCPLMFSCPTRLRWTAASWYHDKRGNPLAKKKIYFATKIRTLLRTTVDNTPR
jgi:hypothetical protein